MANAQLRLFGAPRLLLEGRPRSLPKKPMALLSFLAVTREPVRRESLAGLLWPDSEPAQAATNVRKALWAIRNVAGRDVILPEHPAGTMCLADAVRVDVVAFEELLAAYRAHHEGCSDPCPACAKRLGRAAALYTGDFLSGLTVRASAELDDWQHLHTARLRQEVLGALDDLVAWHVASDMLEAAAACARRQLEIDGLHEEAHRQLMRILAWTGRRVDALRQAEQLERTLGDELGVEPDPETSSLAEDIRANRLPARPGPAPTAPSRDARALRARPRALTDDADPLQRITVRERVPSLVVPEGEPAAALRDSERRLLAALLDGRQRVRLRPEALRAIAARSPTDLTRYYLARVARWALPRYRLDARFVSLSLLVDRGQESVEGRWQAQETRFRSLSDALEEVEEAVVVILGAPGCGKTTLLRHLELQVAARALRRRSDQVPILLELSSFRGSCEGQAEPVDPWSWVSATWRERYPDLPSFERIVDSGRLLLLLDGLNELPHRSALEHFKATEAWKGVAHDVVRRSPSNRLVFACRSLDYSTPLSTPEVPVPQLRVEPLSDDGIERFLRAYAPAKAEALWGAIQEAGGIDVCRVPFFLRMLAQESKAVGPTPVEPAALITSFVRHALRREVERDHPALAPGALLTERDRLRLHQARGWPSPYHLPDDGQLIPRLVQLAHHTQLRTVGREGGRVRLDYDEACRVLGDQARTIIHIGEELSLLDEDLATDEVMFTHQLMQEYFAARRIAADPDAERLRVPWQASEVRPPLADVITTLGAGEALPALPGSGWATPWAMALAMSDDPRSMIRDVARENLALAGRFLRSSSLRDRLDDAVLDELGRDLLERATDTRADLRARLSAASALGAVGDPRMQPKEGAAGTYIKPVLVEVPGGPYPPYPTAPEDASNTDPGPGAPDSAAETLEPFAIGRWPVTVVEWAAFCAAGGYDDERWWQRPAEIAWRSGEGTADGVRATVRFWLAHYRDDISSMEHELESGHWDREIYDRWRKRLQMTPEELEQHLRELYPGGRLTRPAFAGDGRFHRPNSPVVGICWYEAAAYCRWLSATSGRRFRLPTSDEWCAAASGRRRRCFPYGDGGDPLACNVLQTHVRRTTEIGVFPEGVSPVGAEDMSGNVQEWIGHPRGGPREDIASPDNPSGLAPRLRMARGGGWNLGLTEAGIAAREWHMPDLRAFDIGFRVVCEDGTT